MVLQIMDLENMARAVYYTLQNFKFKFGFSHARQTDLQTYKIQTVNNSLKQIVNIQNKCCSKMPLEIKEKKSPLGEGSASVNTIHILPVPAPRSPSQPLLEAPESGLKPQALPGKMAFIPAFPILWGSIFLTQVTTEHFFFIMHLFNFFI